MVNENYESQSSEEKLNQNSKIIEKNIILDELKTTQTIKIEINDNLKIYNDKTDHKDVNKTSNEQIKWMIIIHLVFVVSGVLLALMDRIAASTKVTKKGK